MADLTPKVGQTVQTQDGRQGIIRYSGPLHIATGEWLGLELPDSTGKNDGSVKGERYFQCPPGFGIFVRKESVVKIVKQAAVAQRPNGATPIPHGSTPKPRLSSVVNADVARKRQSLMSAGSGSTGTSRLSLRVGYISGLKRWQLTI
jgi:dynactin 1